MLVHLSHLYILCCILCIICIRSESNTCKHSYKPYLNSVHLIIWCSLCILINLIQSILNEVFVLIGDIGDQFCDLQQVQSIDKCCCFNCTKYPYYLFFGNFAWYFQWYKTQSIFLLYIYM